MSEQGKAARRAAVESAAGALAYVLTVVAVSVVLARRDWIIRQAMAARASWRRDSAREHADREVAEFRRQISDYEHGGGHVD